jgi:hypothetical protein
MALSPEQQAGVKRSMLETFEQILDRLDSYRRPLSRWEEDSLSRAIAAMICGAFVKAALELRVLAEAAAPEIDAGRELSRPPRAFALDIKWFREGLANIRALD